MAKFVGIQIAAPKKSAFSPIKKYETQLLSTSDSLIEKDRGESNGVNVPHNTRNALPLVLKSWIIDERTRGALQLAEINETHVVVSGNQFYRIFENQQEPFTYYSQDDLDYMIGDYKLTANLTEPDGWKECNGQALNRVTYADLFNIISTSFGTGDGSTTFNLPNFKGGRTPMHRDTGVAAFDTLGETGGATTQTLSTANLSVHTHTQNSHTHSTWIENNSSPGLQSAGGGWVTMGRGDDNVGSTTATNQNTGSASAFSIMNPYQVAGIWLIKVTI